MNIALGQVEIRKDNLDVVVLLGTKNMQINCSITVNTSIEPNISALQVSWLMNGTKQLSNTALTPREHTDSFTSTLTVDITGYDKTGNYCCIASLAGRDGDMSDCLIVTVSGTFVFISNNALICYVDIDVSSPYQSLTLGSTAVITCSVTNVTATAIKWLFQNGSVVHSSNVLTLKPVDYTHNGRVFTCSVNSSQLYSPGQKKITVTVKGL